MDMIKGCPFCGSQAWWTKGDEIIRIPDRVFCMECFAEIEGTYEPQSALEKWNTRTLNGEVSQDSLSY